MLIRLNSIRNRLLLSHLLVALIAIGMLSFVMTMTLKYHYTQLETGYLRGNARVFSQLIADMLSQQVDAQTLSMNLNSLAFLSQVRLQVFDVQGNLLRDTGIPKPRTRFKFERQAVPISYTSSSSGDLAVVYVGAPEAAAPSTLASRLGIYIDFRALADYLHRVFGVSSAVLRPWVQMVEAPAVSYSSEAAMPIAGAPTLFGFDFEGGEHRSPIRSSASIERSIHNAVGEYLGTLKISEGPAYGQDMLDALNAATVNAGSVAGGLALAFGLVMSTRMSAPIRRLASVTQRMSRGELSVRSRINRRDELGTLGRTFDQMAEHVENVVATLRRFVADAAHELQTPLTALSTNLQLAADEPVGHKRDGYLRRALEQLERVQRLAADLLDLSRFETTQPDNTPVDLSGLLQDVAETYASRAEQAGINFTLAVPKVRLMVAGNEAQIRRAVGNVLSNAVKFTPDGGSVELACKFNAQRVEIRVDDTGIGIPAEDLSAVFSRFHRGRNAASFPGNGLGLAIVRTIVEHHGGSVQVQPLTPGTRVEIRLPVAL